MKWHNSKSFVILLLLTIMPGTITILYSYSFTGSGIGATSFFWTDGFDEGFVQLYVNSSIPTVTKTIHCERLVIHSFNATGNVVSIEVTCESNGTILEHTMVVGQEIEGIRYPQEKPTGWQIDQNFNVTIFWEGVDAKVSFYYYTEYVGHADGSVPYILPAFYEYQNLGRFLLVGGLVVFSITSLSIIIYYNMNKNFEQ